MKEFLVKRNLFKRNTVLLIEEITVKPIIVGDFLEFVRYRKIPIFVLYQKR